MFSNTFSLCYSLGIENRVSNPYKTSPGHVYKISDKSVQNEDDARLESVAAATVFLSFAGWAGFLIFSSHLCPTAVFIRRSDVCVRSDLDGRKVCYLFHVE